MKLTSIPACQRNSQWLLPERHRSLMKCPAGAQPALAWLQGNGLQLHAILVTPSLCGQTWRKHQYTLSQRKMAKSVEPSSAELIHDPSPGKEWRAAKLPALTGRITQGRPINLFLYPPAQRRGPGHADPDAATLEDDSTMTVALHQRKNRFR